MLFPLYFYFCQKNVWTIVFTLTTLSQFILCCFWSLKIKNAKKTIFHTINLSVLRLVPIFAGKEDRNMKKTLLSAFLFMAFSAMQAIAAPEFHYLNYFSFVEMVQETQISISGNVLRVIDAAGQNVEIFNVTGVRVFCKHIESNDQSFQLGLTRGCYIVKVGKVVRKVNIV